MLWLIAPSFLCLYLAGLGMLSLRWQKPRSSLVDSFALFLGLGLLLNVGLILLLQKLWWGTGTGILLSAYGWYLCWQQRRNFPPVEKAAKWALGLSLAVLLFYLPKLFFEPVKHWDARSIQFFAAKMIFYAGSVGTSAGWQEPVALHPHYPKMLAILAAQVGSSMGFWNDYLPKAALIPIAFPPLYWICRNATNSIGFVFLYIALFLTRGLGFWSGYLDLFLAIYIVACGFFLADFERKKDPFALFQAGLAVAICTNLKQEGYFLTLVLLLYLGWRWWRDSSLRPMIKKFLPMGAILLIPAIIWMIYVLFWQLGSNLPFDYAQLLTNFTTGKNLQLLLSKLFWEQTSIVPLFLMILAFSMLPWLAPVKLGKSWRVFLSLAVIYQAGLIIIYGAHTLTHLMTTFETGSYDRISLPIVYCLIATLSSLLYDLETTAKPTKSPI